MKIYEIQDEWRKVLEAVMIDEETGEIFGAEALDQFQDDARAKVANCARYIREVESEIEAMKTAENAIKSRRQTKEKKIEFLKKLTLRAMEVTGKVEEPDIRVSTRKSEKVIVEKLEDLPPEFRNIVTEIVPMKNEIKKAIKNGVEVAGAYIEGSMSLSIK